MSKKEDKKPVDKAKSANKSEKVETVDKKVEAAEKADETTEKTDSIPESVTLTKDEFTKVKEHIDKLQKEKDETVALAQRIQADFDNYRKRNASLQSDSMNEGARNVIKELLAVLDNFDRALMSADGVDEGWLSGIKLVYKQLLDSLMKCGMEEIPAEGEFDPELHNAVLQEEKEGAKSGEIIEVLQKGYKVKDRIIRHSMVKVAK